MKAIIQAGGKGTRLRPYTLVLPKPLMPVGGLPVIEMLIKWLRRSNIQDIFITTGYLGHLIRSICGDGKQWDCNITYSEEPRPLGTIGALELIRDQLTETFLVLNGDLITDLDLRAFRRFHQEHGDPLTVAVTNKKITVDLGVIEATDRQVTDFHEKPTFEYSVSMGIYCMEPEILRYIPQNVPFGFDDLMYCMLDEKQRVRVYRHHGAWMDIGRPEDFETAQSLFETVDLSMQGPAE